MIVCGGRPITKVPTMDAAALTAALKEESFRLGFDLAGATPAVAPPASTISDSGWPMVMRARCTIWPTDSTPIAIRAECSRGPRAFSCSPRTTARWSRPRPAPAKRACRATPGAPTITRCSAGGSHKLADFHRRLVPGAGVRGVVDTAPLLEREFGRLAGLGWVGKNTLLIHPRLGSWFFLAALLSTEELDYDEPSGVGRCGSCRACLDACPTGALVEPYRLDARKCISYLTVELRDAVPAELRTACRGRLFGCDACQEACPWNRHTPASVGAGIPARPGHEPGRACRVAGT